LANHKSAIKRARQNEEQRMRNKAVKTRVKSVVRDVREGVAEKATETMPARLKAAQSTIDKAVKKGVLHKRTAARKFSRLVKLAETAKS
jgi:small subunit ribosomal protein S20